MSLQAAMDELTQKLREKFATEATDQELRQAMIDLEELQLPPQILWATLLAIADECERREKPA